MKRIFLWGGVLLLVAANFGGCAPVPMDKGKQAESHYILGVSFLREGDPTMALQEFLKAESFDPQRVDVQDALAQAYQLKKSYGNAEKHYLRALELKPDDPNLQNNLGALYLDMREWDKAIACFDKAAGNLLFNYPEYALTNIGLAWLNKGEPERALQSFRKALQQRPGFPPAHYRIGEIFRERGDFVEARERYERALESAPQYALPHFGLGLISLEEGKYDEARLSLRKVVELAGDTEIGEEARRILRTIP